VLVAILIGVLVYFNTGHATALAPQIDRAETVVKKNVHDEARRKQALQIIGQIKSTCADFVKSREKSAKAVNQALDKREVTPQELQSAAAPLLAEEQQVRDRLLDLQFQLRKVLTAEEWAQVYPKPPEQR
jgi:hypothetical protein